jgi:hypothetical protein
VLAGRAEVGALEDPPEPQHGLDHVTISKAGIYDLRLHHDAVAKTGRLFKAAWLPTGDAIVAVEPTSTATSTWRRTGSRTHGAGAGAGVVTTCHN